ncbi:MAG: DegV family protein [Candidatus Izemoplasma sp.]
MKKYALVIDSTTYITEEEVIKYNVTKVSLNVIIKGNTYKELEIENDFVFNELDNGEDITTSQPSPGEFLQTYKKLFKAGYEKIIVLTISDNISGTFQSAVLGKNMLDNPDDVHVFNSRTAAFGAENLTLQLGEMIEQGLPLESIVSKMEYYISNSQLIFSIVNLSALIKSGRLGRTKGLISTVMKIKPIIRMVEGKNNLVKAARTHKKVFNYIMTAMDETISDYSKLHVRILDISSTEQSDKLHDAVIEKYPDAIITTNNYIGPTFSVHLGKQGYGISWATEKEK